MINPMPLIGILCLALVGCVCVIARLFVNNYELEDRLRSPKSSEVLKRCVACGDTYHRDWGAFCPNCTGAD